MASIHRKLLYILLLVIILVLIDGFIIEPWCIYLTETKLKILDSRIPTDTTLKIVQLSDLHITIYGIKEDRILDAVKKTNPDIIVMTGD